jgi:ribonuclease HII
MIKKGARGSQKTLKKSRTRAPDLKWEISLGHPEKGLIGIDEVGRGCLAGPVVAGAVILPLEIDFERDPWLREIADSKLLTPEKREELAPQIEAWARAFGVGVSSVQEIDTINIFQASHLAMTRACEAALDMAQSRHAIQPPQADEFHAVVDGKFLPKTLPCSATAIIKGDLKCLSIAAASILAKVWRDREMVKLDAQYPGFGFATHKGYGTPAHQAALGTLGICPIHRKSFAPIALRAGLAPASEAIHGKLSF